MNKTITFAVMCMVLAVLSADFSLACTEEDGWTNCGSGQVSENWEKMPHSADNFAKLDPPDPGRFGDLSAQEQQNYFSDPDKVDGCAECAEEYYSNPDSVGRNAETDDRYFQTEGNLERSPDAANKYLQVKFINEKVAFEVSSGMTYSDTGGLCSGDDCLKSREGAEDPIPSWATAVRYEDGEFKFDPRLAIKGGIEALGSDTFVFSKGVEITDQETGKTHILGDDVQVRFVENGIEVIGEAEGEWVDALDYSNSYVNSEGRLVITDILIVADNAELNYQEKQIKGRFAGSIENGRLNFISLMEEGSSLTDSHGKARVGKDGSGQFIFNDDGSWQSVQADNSELSYGEKISGMENRQHYFRGEFEVNFNGKNEPETAKLLSKESYYRDSSNDLRIYHDSKTANIFFGDPVPALDDLTEDMAPGESLAFVAPEGNILGYGKIGVDTESSDYRGMQDNALFLRQMEGSIEQVRIDGQEGIVAEFTKRFRIGDLALEEGFAGEEAGIRSVISKEDGKLKMDIGKDSIALLAGIEKDPGRFALMPNSLMLELGEGQAYFGISPDFGMRYEPEGGNAVDFLGPKNTQLFLGEDMEGFMKATAYFSLGKETEGVDELRKFADQNMGIQAGRQASLTLASYYAGKGESDAARSQLLGIIDSAPTSEEAFHAEMIIKRSDSMMFVEAAMRNNEMSYEQWKQRLGLKGFYGGEESLERIRDHPLSAVTDVLNTLNPAYFADYMAEVTKTAPSARDIAAYDKTITEQGLNLVSQMIQKGIASDIPTAINLIKQDGIVQDIQTGEQINVFEGTGIEMDTETFWPDPRTGEIKSYSQAVTEALEKDSMMQVAIEAQQPSATALTREARDAELLKAAAKYRNQENYLAASALAKQVSSSQDREIASQAQELYSDITGEGWFDFSDETLNYGIADAAVSFANPVMLAGYGLAARGGAALLSATRTGQKMLKFTSTAKGSLGGSIGARIVTETGWEGVEAGVGMVPKYGPALEWAAMILDGGPDADYYARQALKDVNYASSGKLYLADGSASPAFIVDDAALSNIKNIKGAEAVEGGFRITDAGGRTFYVAGKSADLTGKNFIEIETAKSDIDSLAAGTDAQARFDEVKNNMQTGWQRQELSKITDDIENIEPKEMGTLGAAAFGFYALDNLKKGMGEVKTNPDIASKHFDDAIKEYNQMVEEMGVGVPPHTHRNLGVAYLEQAKITRDPFLANELYLKSAEALEKGGKLPEAQMIRGKASTLDQRYRQDVISQISKKYAPTPQQAKLVKDYFKDKPITFSTEAEFKKFAESYGLSGVDYKNYKDVVAKSAEKAKDPFRKDAIMRGVGINFLETDLTRGSLGPRALIEETGVDPKDVFKLMGVNAVRFDAGDITLEDLYAGKSPSHNYGAHAKGVDTIRLTESGAKAYEFTKVHQYGASKGSSGKLTLIYDETVTARFRNNEEVIQAEDLIIFEGKIDPGQISTVVVGTPEDGQFVKSMLDKHNARHIRIVDTDGNDLYSH